MRVTRPAFVHRRTGHHRRVTLSNEVFCRWLRFTSRSRRGIEALPLHPFRKTLPAGRQACQPYARSSAKKLLIVGQGLTSTLTGIIQKRPAFVRSRACQLLELSSNSRFTLLVFFRANVDFSQSMPEERGHPKAVRSTAILGRIKLSEPRCQRASERVLYPPSDEGSLAALI